MGRAMHADSPRPSSRPPQRGGGILIALGLMLGAGIGAAVGQPSQGLIIGLGVGAAAAIALVLRDRR